MRILLLLFLSIFAFGDINEAMKFYDKNNFVKAYEIFDYLCEKGSAKSCFFLAYMNENGQGVSKNITNANKFYEKSCRFGLAKACSNLAINLRSESKENEALLQFHNACKLNDTQSCNTLGLFYEKEKDGEMAIYFYHTSCNLKDGRACYKLASIYENGTLVRQNLKTALSYYSKSCSLDFGEACYLLGRYYQKEKNEINMAKRYFAMGCDKRHEQSCAVYKELNSKDIKLY
ncbi:tetratricopeptide repeat protein [Campylobacter sp. LR286c]|uniref:tetratricopeptide repeat protein n=1 Tax=Campylobacter sp. LR286c TaxID=2593545 RepID=UPI0012380107|nr:tetratricopeptide repeat protein [Campylobacter sp. LR286c]KAA6227334.1 sel1 repeat family protein [Campylobacter sp. LR286c]